jgi:hypothetical protein
MKNKEQYIFAGFNSEEKLAAFSKLLNQHGFSIDCLFSDIPVEHPDIKCKRVKSYIMVAGLINGFLGIILAFLFQSWVASAAYPLMTGGKSSFPFLSFIPVMFETGVLFAAFAMFITFFIEKKFAYKKQYKTLNEFKEAFKIAIKTGSNNETTVIVNLLTTHDGVEFKVEIKE